MTFFSLSDMVPGLAWRPTPLVLRTHSVRRLTDAGTGWCDQCHELIAEARVADPCVIDTVGIACGDCGDPVLFPLTAPDLTIYQMKGTLCSACLAS